MYLISYLGIVLDFQGAAGPRMENKFRENAEIWFHGTAIMQCLLPLAPRPLLYSFDR